MAHAYVTSRIVSSLGTTPQFPQPNLIKGAYKLHPKLVGKEKESFVYGFNLKKFPDEPIKVSLVLKSLPHELGGHPCLSSAPAWIDSGIGPSPGLLHAMPGFQFSFFLCHSLLL
jgi:hypothetical protein